MTRYDFMEPHEIITRHTRPRTRGRRTAPLINQTLRYCIVEYHITFEFTESFKMNRSIDYDFYLMEKYSVQLYPVSKSVECKNIHMKIYLVLRKKCLKKIVV